MSACCVALAASCAEPSPVAEPHQVQARATEVRSAEHQPNRSKEVSPSAKTTVVPQDQESSEDGANSSETSFGAMTAVRPSAQGERLRALGLNPAQLPQMAALSPVQRFQVMKLISESLGVECEHCHQGEDYRASTPQKDVARFMWNEMTAPRSLKDGELFCDSCHQGTVENLDRTRRERVEAYMSQEYVGKLVRRDTRESVKCSDCHGEPFQNQLFEKSWK